MDHVVSLTSTDVLDKNLTELCKDAGKVLFKGTDPKLLLSGMQCSATRESCEGSQKVLQDVGFALFEVIYRNKYSPNWSPYISLKNVLREFDKRSRHFLLGDHFILIT